MIHHSFIKLLAIPMVFALSACGTTGEKYEANVYKAHQVNQQQEIQTIKILTVLPAKIEASNREAKEKAQLVGGIVGALAGGVIGNELDEGRGTLTGGAVGGGVGVAAGSLVKDAVIVEGVSLVYEVGGKTFNSVQVGQACAFQPGAAFMVTTYTDETRIQPNAECSK